MNVIAFVGSIPPIKSHFFEELKVSKILDETRILIPSAHWSNVGFSNNSELWRNVLMRWTPKVGEGNLDINIAIIRDIFNYSKNLDVTIYDSSLDSPVQLSFKAKNSTCKTLAYLSPMPPQKTGIANYSASIIQGLEKKYSVDLYTNAEVPDAKDYSDFKNHYSNYDRVVYQIGNSPFHKELIALAHQLPGIVVLHDVFLSDYMLNDARNTKNFDHLVRSIYEEKGVTGVQNFLANPIDGFKNYSYAWSSIINSVGIIVNSRFAKDLLINKFGLADGKVYVSRLPVMDTPKVSRFEARSSLGIPFEAKVIATLGFVDEVKCTLEVIEAFESLSRQKPDMNLALMIVGANHGGSYGNKVLEAIRNLSVTNKVLLTGFVEKDIYLRYLAATDIFLQLRRGSKGESSAAVIDALSEGKKCIVNSVGSFSEWPPELVRQIPGDFSQADIVNALGAELRILEKMSSVDQERKRIVESTYSQSIVSELYADAIENFYNKPHPSKKHLYSALKGIKGVKRSFELWELQPNRSNRLRGKKLVWLKSERFRHGTNTYKKLWKKLIDAQQGLADFDFVHANGTCESTGAIQFAVQVFVSQNVSYDIPIVPSEHDFLFVISESLVEHDLSSRLLSNARYCNLQSDFSIADLSRVLSHIKDCQ